MHNWSKLYTEIKVLKDEQKAAVTFISKATCLIWIHRDERVKQSHAERLVEWKKKKTLNPLIVWAAIMDCNLGRASKQNKHTNPTILP